MNCGGLIFRHLASFCKRSAAVARGSKIATRGVCGSVKALMSLPERIRILE